MVSFEVDMLATIVSNILGNTQTLYFSIRLACCNAGSLNRPGRARNINKTVRVCQAMDVHKMAHTSRMLVVIMFLVPLDGTCGDAILTSIPDDGGAIYGNTLESVECRHVSCRHVRKFSLWEPVGH